MTQGNIFETEPGRWVDAGTCRHCRRTLWRVAETGAVVSKITLSKYCRSGKTHEVKP